MNTFRADIHCHSTYSDGTVSPKDLLLKAKAVGLSGFSITDHDTVEAYSTALPFAQELGIKMISGAEFSCVHKKISVHILGYSFDVTNPLILEFCQRHHNRRFFRNQEILKKIAKQGIQISYEEVEALSALGVQKSKRTIGRPHIAQVMMQKGYVKSVAEAFKLYLGEDRPCYAPGESFSVEETLDLIHRAHGLVVIAHPHLLSHSKIMTDLLEMPFDGIECFYSRQHPEINKRFIKIATKKNWLMTGGSDYHGDIKPDIPLGCSWINEDTFNILHQHFLGNL